MTDKLPPWYVTGLVDGEGCFSTEFQKGQRVYPIFVLGLRADDRELVFRIRDYFGFGVVRYVKAQKVNHNPQWHLRIQAQVGCRMLIRHFDVYPLQSKKVEEYLVWRELVLLPKGTPLEYRLQLRMQLAGPKTYHEHSSESSVVEDAQRILDLSSHGQPKENS